MPQASGNDVDMWKLLKWIAEGGDCKKAAQTPAAFPQFLSDQTL